MKTKTMPVTVEFTAGQLGKIASAARRFGCTESDMVVALACGNLAMHGRVEGGEEENGLNVAEFVREFAIRRRTPRIKVSGLIVPKGGEQ